MLSNLAMEGRAGDATFATQRRLFVMAWALIAVGFVLIVFTVLLAFTPYAVVAALVGVLAIASGAWMVSRRPPPPG